MDFEHVISNRRSVRSYTERPVDDSTVHGLLRAAVLAPSAMNAQPCIFAVIQSRQRLAAWSDRAKAALLRMAGTDEKTAKYAPVLQDPAFNVFYDAGTLIVIGVREHTPFSQADCWLAAENLMLAATNAELGTCTIGFALSTLNEPEIKTDLGIPPTGEAVAAIIVGHPRSVAGPVPRRAPEIVRWLR